MKATKVLILDDDPFIVSLLVNIFHRRGCDVVTYSSPAACPLYSDATCECKQGEPCASVIVSDYDMPLVNGVEFLESLKKRGCRCAHTALASGSFPAQETMDRLAKLGIKFFAKPFHKDQIIDWLNQIEPALGSRENNQGSQGCGDADPHPNGSPPDCRLAGGSAADELGTVATRIDKQPGKRND